MSSLAKRIHSRSPDDARRVRQRTLKRSESPEEGEVDDGGEVEHGIMPEEARSGSGMESQPNENNEQLASGAASKPKVAFPFKTKVSRVRSLPKADLVNGSAPPKRRSPSPRSATTTSTAQPSLLDRISKGDTYRPPARDNNDDNYRRRDSYVPSRDRDRSRERRSPRGYRRSRSPPYSRSNRHDYDGPPMYRDDRNMYPRGTDSYRPRSPPRGRNSRSPPPSRGDYYRPRTPPRRSVSQERGPGGYGYSQRHSPPPLLNHRLPTRPPPDRYFPPSRYEEDFYPEPHRDRQPDLPGRRTPPRENDKAFTPQPVLQQVSMTPTGPPPPPADEPPPLPAADIRIMNSAMENRQPPIDTSLPPRPVHGLPPRPNFAQPFGNGITHPQQHPQPPRDMRQSGNYNNRPEPPLSMPARPPSPPKMDQQQNEIKRESAPEDQRQPPSGKSATRWAKVRTREEEREAYGRDFVGSGRLSEYTIMRKLGEGTFGEVHQARRLKESSQHGIRDLALKRIIMHSEKEGMPITALREIKILKALNHPNIVKVLDIVVTPRTPKDAGSVYMVFPYMDHDLAGLLENPEVKLSPSHVKAYMKQLLEGLEYMHSNNVIHRDIKAANILINNEGILQIADFGLARAFTNKSKKEKLEKGFEKHTNCVVTRWYRPPELLMGERYYGAEIDLWGIGCILAEMFVRRPILQGNSDMDQLEKIWWLCGTPTRESWPDFENLPGMDGVKEFKPRPKELRQQLGRYESITRETLDLIEALLTLDPSKRPTALDALLHQYFWTAPLPADPKTLPKYESSHELDRRQKGPPAPPPNAHQQQYRGHAGGQPFHNNNYNHRGHGRNGPGGRPYQHHGGGPKGGPPQRYGGGPPHMNGPPIAAHPPPIHLGMNGGGPPGFPPPGGQLQGPPQNHTPSDLPQPRGFRPPPRQQQQQQQFPPRGYKPNGPNGGPMGVPGGPPRGPPPPNDGMVLHYG